MKYKNEIVVYSSLLMMLILVIIGSYSISHQTTSSKGCNVINEKEIYIAVNETYTLPELEKSNSIFVKNKYGLENDSVTLNKNLVTGIQNGTSIITYKCNQYTIHVSDLYQQPTLNNNKPFLPCGVYSQTDNDYLDSILEYKINNVGYLTRAGAVEAARFLTLQFPYKLAYFYENGRLEKNEDFLIEKADGEGRYYHKGLYLNDSRFIELDKEGIMYGPATWGCSLYSVPVDENTPNGFDCSGFVTWVLYNAGYTEVGDIGAGPTGGILDLSDIGKKVNIQDVEIEKLQPGDLLGFDGHITIIIGIDEENIYIAQDYWEGDLSVLTQSKGSLKTSVYEYALYMDNFYINKGKLTNMWN